MSTTIGNDVYLGYSKNRAAPVIVKAYDDDPKTNIVTFNADISFNRNAKFAANSVVTIPKTPQMPYDAVNKQYVDDITTPLTSYINSVSRHIYKQEIMTTSSINIPRGVTPKFNAPENNNPDKIDGWEFIIGPITDANHFVHWGGSIVNSSGNSSITNTTVSYSNLVNIYFSFYLNATIPILSPSINPDANCLPTLLIYTNSPSYPVLAYTVDSITAGTAGTLEGCYTFLMNFNTTISNNPIADFNNNSFQNNSYIKELVFSSVYSALYSNIRNNSGFTYNEFNNISSESLSNIQITNVYVTISPNAINTRFILNSINTEITGESYSSINGNTTKSISGTTQFLYTNASVCSSYFYSALKQLYNDYYHKNVEDVISVNDASVITTNFE